MMHQYKSIEICRGIAALFVAIYHLSRLYEQNYGVFPFTRVTEVGHLGVDFFFVLSGFIIYYIHSTEVGQVSKLKPYIIKRFSRVYPFFWFVILLNLLLIPFVSSKELPDLAQLFLNLSLLPFKEYFVIGVSWTLQHEIIFYAIFSLLFINRKLGILGLGLWLLVIIASSLNSAFTIPVISSSFNIQFFLGLAVAYLLKVNKLPKKFIILPTAILALIITCYFELHGSINHHSIITRILYGLIFAGILVGCISSESVIAKYSPSLMLKLGSSSYAIYLLHLFFGAILFKLFTLIKINEVIPLTLSATVLIILTIYCSHITSRLIELPLSKATRKFLLDRSH